MANYTAEDVQKAVQAGLISPEDGESLMGGLDEGVPWGQIAGGAAGAALGGAAMGKLGGMAGRGAAKMAFSPPKVQGKMGRAADAMAEEIPIPGMPTHSMSPAAMAGGALGAGAGGMAGASMMDDSMGEYPEGGGMEAAEQGLSEDDRTMALQALMDPSTPPGVKKQIMEILQQYDAQEAESGGFPYGAVGGGLAGAALGAGGMKLAQRAMPAAMGKGANMGAMNQFGHSPAATLAGGIMGAGGGAMLGDFAQAAMRKPYEDPLAEQQGY